MCPKSFLSFSQFHAPWCSEDSGKLSEEALAIGSRGVTSLYVRSLGWRHA